MFIQETTLHRAEMDT